MNRSSDPEALTLSIAAVERDTGLSKDTLRVWERRYGFPTPARDDGGERAYPLEQVERLRTIKRLLDAGHRPGRVVPMPESELRHLADATVDAPERRPLLPAVHDPVAPLLALIRGHDVDGLRHALSREAHRLGLMRFVDEVVAPLNTAVGDAWLRGQVAIFEEHLYTELLQSVLRQLRAAVPPPPPSATPRVLLGTLPGEPHGVGLLMVEATLALEGAQCFSLGVQTPAWDIVQAAAALRADIVALSFTGCSNPNQIVASLQELRAKLPPTTALWVGGGAPVLRRRVIDGVLALAELTELPAAVKTWRDAAPATRP
jgi:methanogenic corrinoid protein MtbC1